MTISLHQMISMVVNSFLAPLREEYAAYGFDYEIAGGWADENFYCLDVRGYSKAAPGKVEPFTLLKLYVNYNYKEVAIHNIYLPYSMRYRGLGKQLIGRVYAVVLMAQWKLFLVDMVDSFYQRMRGASPCPGFSDVLQITPMTVLE